MLNMIIITNKKKIKKKLLSIALHSIVGMVAVKCIASSDMMSDVKEVLDEYSKVEDLFQTKKKKFHK